MANKVEIYTTPTCHYCKLTKEFFKAHNITYIEYDVQTDAVRREEVIRKSGQLGVPVIIVTPEGGKETMVIGFDEEKLTKLLLS